MIHGEVSGREISARIQSAQVIYNRGETTDLENNDPSHQRVNEQ
jgi:hypothetical protein